LKSQRQFLLILTAIYHLLSKLILAIFLLALLSLRNLLIILSTLLLFSQDLFLVPKEITLYMTRKGHFLKGATSPFVIYSDHRNLPFQKKPEKMTQKLVRWPLFFSEFNFKILYRSGASNGKPDALSRRPDYMISDVPFSILRPENFCTLSLVRFLLSMTKY